MSGAGDEPVRPDEATECNPSDKAPGEPDSKSDVPALPERDNPQPKNPLHGITLEQIVMSLSQYYGWEYLGSLIPIRCFQYDPNLSSSLKFLRKTPWARSKVEELYLDTDWQAIE